MSMAWHPELRESRSRFCAEFEHRCLQCGQPIARRGPSAELVIETACRAFDLTREELLSSSRHADLVDARAFVVWALRSLGRPRSYVEIGQLLGRDQSSVNHLHRKAIAQRLADNDFDAACRGFGERWKLAGETRHARCR